MDFKPGPSDTLGLETSLENNRRIKICYGVVNRSREAGRYHDLMRQLAEYNGLKYNDEVRFTGIYYDYQNFEEHDYPCISVLFCETQYESKIGSIPCQFSKLKRTRYLYLMFYQPTD